MISAANIWIRVASVTSILPSLLTSAAFFCSSVNLKDSFCILRNGELFTRGMHISPYEKGNVFNRDPMRVKRLLMHKREIRKLGDRIAQEGVALIPLRLYFKDSRVKVELGLCKGKKLYDKRESDARREAERDMDRARKERNYT